MASHGPLISPQRRKLAHPASPKKILRYDAFQGPSSPGRPSIDRKNHAVSPVADEQGDYSSAHPKHETWLEDGHPGDVIRNTDDGEDPHDLSFSSRHVPRASMVDSMVLSLDQFSGRSASYSNYKDSHAHPSAKPTRRRGHTLSSSVSSENDIRHGVSTTAAATATAHVNRRNSTAKYAKDTAKLPSIFGDDEDSVRVRVYEAQRAELPAKKITRRRQDQNRKNGSKGGSASSSVDLSHLNAHAGRLGPAGNRRSQSFDFGSRTRKDTKPNPSDSFDVAPTPVVFAGPKAAYSPISPSFHNVPLARKNSTKSSKSAYGRKGRSGTIGTNTIKGKGEEVVPDMPIRNDSFQAVTSLESKQLADTAQMPRPGFFRRVFGSSKTITTVSDASSVHNVNATIPKQEREHSTPDDENETDASAPKSQKTGGAVHQDNSSGKENNATITKKSSAFFRRRKKSNSAVIPPPLPLTLNNNLRAEPVQTGETSPVSSLRAFMGPYLAETQRPRPPSPLQPPPLKSPFMDQEARPDSSPAYHSAHSTPQLSEAQFEARPEESSIMARNPRPKLRMPEPKPTTMLKIPHQESFLADSSSTEEPSKRNRHETPSPTFDRPKTSPINRATTEPPRVVNDFELGLGSVSPTYSRPSIPPRSESWQGKTSVPLSPPPSKQRQATLLSTVTHIKTGQTEAEEDARRSPSLSLPMEGATLSPQASNSDVSDYRSAPSTPLFLHASAAEPSKPMSPVVHVSHPSVSENKSQTDKEQAERIFENRDEFIDPADASAWLGDPGTDRERIRKEYMRLFDWTNLNILAAMRALCDRIALKGETQQVDRMLDAFAQRWCECNPRNGFRSNDVVHTICYSILLLNTDLHLADIGQKMTRSQFVRNALPTIVRVAEEAEANSTLRGSSLSHRTPTPVSDHHGRKPSLEEESAAAPNIGRSAEESLREETGEVDAVLNLSGPLVETPFTGSEKAWEAQIELVLKSFYTAVSRQRLPLFGAAPDLGPQIHTSGNLFSTAGNMLRRTPSTLSKAPSDTFRGRSTMENKSMTGRWTSKTRSRPRLGGALGFGSSRTSLDDHSSGWSPSMSSTWSKASLGKTLTSMSVDSFGSDGIRGDYQSSIGFANALSQAIIREDQLEIPPDDLPKAGSLLEDESLGLCGAPWAKEGIVKHKCHLDGVDKKSKDRNWNDCFAVIEKGWVRLFSFSVNAKSVRQKAKSQKAGAVVGGGNWQDNAEEVFKLMLRHTIASTLPPPGYSKARPYVWALSLPTGAVHLFSVGTPDIVKEFVQTANYWSARLSKEPMMGGVSNMEYGWSDNVITRTLLAPETSAHLHGGATSPRPSTQMSVRSSIDQGGFRPKLAGDKAYINDWSPPQQSMMASQLMEVDQLRNLQTYVKNVEDDLQKHNELRPAMLSAFTARHPNMHKSMTNWEKKSAYLLREIVKFRTYIDILQTAKSTKEKIHAMRKEDDETRRNEDDTRAMAAAMGL